MSDDFVWEPDREDDDNRVARWDAADDEDDRWWDRHDELEERAA